MRRQAAAAGSKGFHAAPLALPLLLALPVLGCTGNQSAVNPKSPDAELVADLWWAMLAVAAVSVLAVTAIVAAAAVRSLWQRAPFRLDRREGWAVVLTAGIAIPFVAIAAMVLSSLAVSRAVSAPPAAADLTVEVVGRLWWWEVNYLDRNGETLATTANEIHIPVGQRVRFRLVTDNVIHSFWVPNLQGKTDLVPGQVNESWLTAAEPGVYRGQCAELCGIQHALMAFLVVAEPAADFELWLDRQRQEALPPYDDLTERGREVFLGACAQCHAIRGTPARATLGPDLTHLASRRSLAAGTLPNTRGHLGGWIMNPQNIKPGSLMPAAQLMPADLQALLAYLGTLR